MFFLFNALQAFCIVLLATFIHSESFAQGNDLKKVLDLSLEKSEAPKLERSKQGQSKAQANQAKSALFPKIQVLATYTKEDASAREQTDADSATAKLNVTQSLFSGFRDQAILASTKSRLAAQEDRLAQSELDLRLSVASSFFAVLLAEREHKNSSALSALSKRRVDELGSRVKIGRTRPTDLLSARAQQAAQDAQVAAAKTKIATARIDFSEASGLRPELSLDDNFALPNTLPSLSSFLNEAEQIPAVGALKSLVAANQNEIKAAKALHYPSLDLFGNYYLYREEPLDKNKWDVGIQLSLPLYQGGMVSAQIHEQSEKLNQSELELTQRQRLIRSEISRFYESTRGNLEELKVSQESLSLAKKTYKQLEKDYRLGLANNLEVIQAFSAIAESQRSLDRLEMSTKSLYAQLLILTRKPL